MKRVFSIFSGSLLITLSWLTVILAFLPVLYPFLLPLDFFLLLISWIILLRTDVSENTFLRRQARKTLKLEIVAILLLLVTAGLLFLYTNVIAVPHIKHEVRILKDATENLNEYRDLLRHLSSQN